jgi:hypothetical protein
MEGDVYSRPPAFALLRERRTAIVLEVASPLAE